MRKNILFIVCMLSFKLGYSQSRVSDSSQVFSIKDLFFQIENYHPLFQIANIQEQVGQVNRKKAIGNFEPTVSFDQKNKTFDGKNYYNQQFFELDIYSPSPLSFSVGVEKTSGLYLNNEAYTPKEGLGYLGMQVPLLKNLITDQRRTLLQQSKNFKEQSTFQRKSMIQTLYLDIWKNYIQWYINHEQTKSLSKALDLSNIRLDAIRKVYSAGGCSGFDTLEIAVQQQQFMSKLIENEIITLKSKILLNVHLWTVNEQKELQAIAFKPGIAPSNQFFEILNRVIDATAEQNELSSQPDLMVSQRKIDNLQLDLRLKQNYLLPKLDLKYQYLNTAFNSYNSISDNSVFGIFFASPLFFIGPRADYQESKFKLAEAQMSLKFKKREINQKSTALFKQVESYKRIYEMLKQVESGYFQLYQMEIKKFNSGDGTVFLLNSREAKYWEANLKTIEHYGKLLNTMVEYLSVCGTIHRFNEVLN